MKLTAEYGFYFFLINSDKLTCFLGKTTKITVFSAFSAFLHIVGLRVYENFYYFCAKQYQRWRERVL